MGDEGPPEWVLATQESLGQMIKRPKLTDALLQKPPFRFLHDVVTEVTKETGFAAGLFTEEHEVNSAKIKVKKIIFATPVTLVSHSRALSLSFSQDKDSKIAYLTKIINCVNYHLNTQLNIRVGKVVAGLEAENTNAFLQALYQCAASGADSSAAVNRVLDEMGGGQPPPPGADAYDQPPPPPPAREMPPPLPQPEANPALPPPPPMPERDATSFQTAPMRKPEEEGGQQPGAGGADGAPTDGAGKRVRPKSARRPPPRVQNNEVKVDKSLQRPGAGPLGDGAPPVAGVILEGGLDDDDAGIEMVDNAGDAVNTSSMGGGPGSLVGGGTMDGPKGRLGKNLLEAKNEMEAMGEERERQAAEPEEEEQAAGGIILRKKGGRDGGGGKLPSKGEVSALRSSIQTLCQSSNPLGRCLEYVQEDLEAMGKELESWRAVRHRRAGELSDEEATTASALVGLKAELEKVEEMIREKHAQIRFAKASIIQNDEKVEQLLSQVVRA